MTHVCNSMVIFGSACGSRSTYVTKSLAYELSQGSSISTSKREGIIVDQAIESYADIETAR